MRKPLPPRRGPMKFRNCMGGVVLGWVVGGGGFGGTQLLVRCPMSLGKGKKGRLYSLIGSPGRLCAFTIFLTRRNKKAEESFERVLPKKRRALFSPRLRSEPRKKREVSDNVPEEKVLTDSGKKRVPLLKGLRSPSRRLGGRNSS